MNELELRKDKQWKKIDSELCLIEKFTPLKGSRIESGNVISPSKNTPYASLLIKCASLSEYEQVIGYVTHKQDFEHLWSIFNERGVRDEEEVVMYWTVKHYKSLAKIMPNFGLPKMILAVCRKGTYSATGLKGFKIPEDETTDVPIFALMPIDNVKPEVID